MNPELELPQLEGRLELGPAVAAQGAERVACEALRVDPDHRVRRRRREGHQPIRLGPHQPLVGAQPQRPLAVHEAVHLVGVDRDAILREGDEPTALGGGKQPPVGRHGQRGEALPHAVIPPGVHPFEAQPVKPHQPTERGDPHVAVGGAHDVVEAVDGDAVGGGPAAHVDPPGEGG